MELRDALAHANLRGALHTNRRGVLRATRCCDVAHHMGFRHRRIRLDDRNHNALNRGNLRDVLSPKLRGDLRGDHRRGALRTNRRGALRANRRSALRAIRHDDHHSNYGPHDMDQSDKLGHSELQTRCSLSFLLSLAVALVALSSLSSPLSPF